MTANTEVLISPKPFKDYTPEEFHSHVKSMYKERELSGTVKSPSAGIAFTRTKAGKLSVRFTKKLRAFKYILESEIPKVIKHYSALEIKDGELREVLQGRDFIVTATRLDAEKIYALREKK